MTITHAFAMFTITKKVLQLKKCTFAPLIMIRI